MTTSATRRFIAAASLAVLASAASAARAVSPGDERPDPSRLYLRFNLGLGWDTASSVNASGLIAAGAIGVRVIPSLAVYLESFNQIITSHEKPGIGADFGLGRFSALGAGLVWTVPVIGVHVAQTFSDASLNIPSELGAGIDSGGFVMQTMLGKDWPVSRRWWLGVGGHAAYGIGLRLFGVSASLTYN